MIRFNLEITNPWSNRWNIIFSKNGRIGLHKGWEFNGYQTHSFVEILCGITSRCDHAGIQLMLGLFGYNVEFNLYDTRHWDYELGKWCTYPITEERDL